MADIPFARQSGNTLQLAPLRFQERPLLTYRNL